MQALRIRCGGDKSPAALVPNNTRVGLLVTRLLCGAETLSVGYGYGMQKGICAK